MFSFYKVSAGKPIANVKGAMEEHAGIRYESSDPGIARVSANGKISGISKGSCFIYCYAQNGRYRRVKVVVQAAVEEEPMDDVAAELFPEDSVEPDVLEETMVEEEFPPAEE